MTTTNKLRRHRPKRKMVIGKSEYVKAHRVVQDRLSYKVTRHKFSSKCFSKVGVRIKTMNAWTVSSKR